MELNILFVWQNERPSSGCFILNTLEDACIKLSKQFSIKMTVIPSDPKKIKDIVSQLRRESTIAVVDLTPTSTGFDGRINPNANVLYEFGLLSALLTDSTILPVMDLNGVQSNQLPFSLSNLHIIGFASPADDNFKASLKNALKPIVAAKMPQTTHDATTVFFAKRIAAGFPGIRGTKWLIDPDEIKIHMDAFFSQPYVFDDATDRNGDRAPIWWFRGKLAQAIEHYEPLPGGIYLIDNLELKIKAIVVFADPTFYYKEYIYIETYPMQPIDKERFTPELIEELKKKEDYILEEYAVFKDGNIEVEISRAEFDDGYANINGKIVPIEGRASVRCRYLTPFNLLVAAKYSPYNSPTFSFGSDRFFNGILDGSERYDDFHKYLMGFTKHFNS